MSIFLSPKMNSQSHILFFILFLHFSFNFLKPSANELYDLNISTSNFALSLMGFAYCDILIFKEQVF